MRSGNPGGLSKQLGRGGGGGSSPSGGSFRLVVPGVGTPKSWVGKDIGIWIASLSNRTSRAAILAASPADEVPA